MPSKHLYIARQTTTFLEPVNKDFGVGSLKKLKLFFYYCGLMKC